MTKQDSAKHTRVIIIRHGEAEPSFTKDSARRLTKMGEKQVLAAAHDINAHLSIDKKIDIAFVSPYVRAQQTFDILKSTLSINEVLTTNAITPGGTIDKAYWLVSDASITHSTLLLVSHMPLVSFLTAELCRLHTPPMFTTSGFAIVDFDSHSSLGVLQAIVHQHD